MTNASKASHVGSALSVIDILAVLYSGTANITKDNLASAERDVVILSKGHAASALYATLALCEFFPISWLAGYGANGSPLGGHVTSKHVPGVELSTGSLGHGFPYAVGVALARKRRGIRGQVFVIISDGECDEGTTWESALLANHHKLDNLTVIIDRNGIQSLGSTEETLALEPLAEKWCAFGWQAVQIDGHDFVELESSLAARQGPKVIIAITTKGKGVSFMENSVLWHYKSPNNEELKSALFELKSAK